VEKLSLMFSKNVKRDNIKKARRFNPVNPYVFNRF